MRIDELRMNPKFWINEWMGVGVISRVGEDGEEDGEDH